MAMNDIDALAQDDVAEYGEEGKDGRKTGGPVNDEEGNVINFESIGEISYSCPALISVRDDDDLVAPVPEFAGQLVNVALDSSWLWKEEVANHSDVVCGRHCCCGSPGGSFSPAPAAGSVHG